MNKILRASLAASLLFATVCGASVHSQSSSPPMRPNRSEDPDQYYKAPSSLHGKTVVLPIGTTFSGRIDHTISSTHSRDGERFSLVVDNPVLVNGSDVVIPTGSRIIGEVVEAVPADRVPRQPWDKKILVRGKLRITVSGLVTPDGSTYPLVATIKGEVPDKNVPHFNDTPIGTSVGYMGSAAGFEAVNANRAAWQENMRYSGGIPKVMAKKDFLKDEVMGLGGDSWMHTEDNSTVRSLVLKKRDYYIYQGSPLTVKVTAPFKIGIASPGLGAAIGTVDSEPQDPTLPPPSRGNGGAADSGSGRFTRDQGGQPPVSHPSPAGMPADSF